MKTVAIIIESNGVVDKHRVGIDDVTGFSSLNTPVKYVWVYFNNNSSIRYKKDDIFSVTQIEDE